MCIRDSNFSDQKWTSNTEIFSTYAKTSEGFVMSGSLLNPKGPPANCTVKARSVILPISLCGIVHNPNISCAGQAREVTVFPVGIVNVPQWAKNIWASISIFMEGEWT